MEKMSQVKKSIITAACIALCVVLPMAFHALGPAGGHALLPMHIPVLLCGLICGWAFGLLAGIAGPLLSSLFTGMPGPAMLPSMMVELAAYGLAAGLLMYFIRTKKCYIDLYISLIAAMILGRALAGLTRAFIFTNAEEPFTIALWIAGYFVNSLPGIILQLMMIPSIVIALETERLIPRRYPKQRS